MSSMVATCKVWTSDVLKLEHAGVFTILHPKARGKILMTQNNDEND